METYIQDNVILKLVDGQVTNIIRKNGKVEGYKCKPMGYGDYVEMLGANIPEIKKDL